MDYAFHNNTYNEERKFIETRVLKNKIIRGNKSESIYNNKINRIHVERKKTHDSSSVE